MQLMHERLQLSAQRLVVVRCAYYGSPVHAHRMHIDISSRESLQPYQGGGGGGWAKRQQQQQQLNQN